ANQDRRNRGVVRSVVGLSGGAVGRAEHGAGGGGAGVDASVGGDGLADVGDLSAGRGGGENVDGGIVENDVAAEKNDEAAGIFIHAAGDVPGAVGLQAAGVGDGRGGWIAHADAADELPGE